MNELKTFAEKLDQLATGTQKRFKVTKQLTIDDMIKLITPPLNPLLLEQGKFKFTTDHTKANLTANGGALVSGFVVPDFYASSKKMLDNPNDRPNLTLRLHFDVTETDGNLINWGIEGTVLSGVWNPSRGNTSDYELQRGVLIDEHNALQFAPKGRTVINLANSYMEIMGG